MVLNPEDDDNGNDKNHKSLYYEVLYFVGMTNIASLILPLKNIIVTKNFALKRYFFCTKLFLHGLLCKKNIAQKRNSCDSDLLVEGVVLELQLLSSLLKNF